MHSVPTNNPSGDFIVKDLAPLLGEPIILPNGPNKFLPCDLEFNRYPDFDLERVFKDRGIKTIITVGTHPQHRRRHLRHSARPSWSPLVPRA